MTLVAPVHERPVDDVGVPGDPADVGRAPVDVVIGIEVEDVLVGVGDLGEVAAAGVHDALGLRRGSARIEEVQEILGVHHLGRAFRRLLRYDVVPPDVAPFGHRDVALGRALEDQHLLDRRAIGDRDIGRVLGSATTWPRLHAPSAVITTFASASLMRSRSESDEKPPNTTEMGAPMRARTRAEPSGAPAPSRDRCRPGRHAAHPGSSGRWRAG